MTRVTKASKWRAGHKILARLANQALGELEPAEEFTPEQMLAATTVLPYLVPQVRAADNEGDNSGFTVRVVNQVLDNAEVNPSK